jgi:two-component system CheB/CheR fusion protein
MTDPMDPRSDFDLLLAYIRRTRGFDFSAYKIPSLTRRIRKRMQMVSVDTFTDYQDYLEVHPDEFTFLFNTILINVTSFFRDEQAWNYIASDVIPRIIAAKQPNDPIRIWSAGSASGEEAYTVAMLLAEQLGTERFRERVKIYASDVDEEALDQARQATYSERETESIPPEMLEKYFERSNHRAVFRKDLRRAVIFGRHDLIQDAPISRIDLLLCRNTLMYFNAETQTRIVTRFHFALNDTGYLFLGKAEMLFTLAEYFTPVDLKRRVFAKVPRTTTRERVFYMGPDGDDNHGSSIATKLREAAYNANPVAQIVLDRDTNLILLNERAQSLLRLAPRDVGRPLRNLELSALISDLRLEVESALNDRRIVILKDHNWLIAPGDLRTLEVQVTPLDDAGGAQIGASITFTDVTRARQLQLELEHSNQELETAYEELQSTNEELETTNEELQSTIEELETTNEELQSTNEELETINEELQSTNEEMHTVNAELRRRTNELNQVNVFFESILASMPGGVVVLDRDYRIQIWSAKAEGLWGLRSDEVANKPFLNLDIGLPVEQLKPLIRAALGREEGETTLVLQATNRRGKLIQCKVTCTPLLTQMTDNPSGVLLLMEEMAAPTDR